MLSIVGWVVCAVLILVISIPLYGLLIALEWGWFVAPILGAREITIPQGVGLSLFLVTAGLVATGHLREFKSQEGKEAREMAIHSLAEMAGIGIIGPLAGIFMAWTWHTFFM